MRSTFKAIAGSVVANSIAVAVAFGANISVEKQDAILALVGSVSTAITALVTWRETHIIRAHAAIATNGGLLAPTAQSHADKVLAG